MNPLRLFFAAALSGSALPALAQEASVKVPAMDVPYSDLASPEAGHDFIAFRDVFKTLMGCATELAQVRECFDQRIIIPNLARLRKRFPVDIRAEKIGGVQTDVVEPAGGVLGRNRKRVLINLHGGGFTIGARYSGQMESVPIASLGGFKVVTVDYRMGPENHFPAASEDVAAVYRALLSTYRPEDIGIYGCSAGGMLTAEAIAWFDRHGLPMPGAIGLFGSGALAGMQGDTAMLFAPLIGWPVPSDRSKEARGAGMPYFAGADLDDPLASPIRDSALMGRFPATLLVTGTRDTALSSAAATQAALVEAGVEADLHVFEGAPHCSFAQPLADPDVPENQMAWRAIVAFFDKHLGVHR